MQTVTVLVHGYYYTKSTHLEAIVSNEFMEDDRYIHARRLLNNVASINKPAESYTTTRSRSNSVQKTIISAGEAHHHGNGPTTLNHTRQLRVKGKFVSGTKDAMKFDDNDECDRLAGNALAVEVHNSRPTIGMLSPSVNASLEPQQVDHSLQDVVREEEADLWLDSEQYFKSFDWKTIDLDLLKYSSYAPAEDRKESIADSLALRTSSSNQHQRLNFTTTPRNILFERLTSAFVIPKSQPCDSDRVDEQCNRKRDTPSTIDQYQNDSKLRRMDGGKISDASKLSQDIAASPSLIPSVDVSTFQTSYFQQHIYKPPSRLSVIRALRSSGVLQSFESEILAFQSEQADGVDEAIATSSGTHDAWPSSSNLNSEIFFKCASLRGNLTNGENGSLDEAFERYWQEYEYILGLNDGTLAKDDEVQCQLRSKAKDLSDQIVDNNDRLTILRRVLLEAIPPITNSREAEKQRAAIIEKEKSIVSKWNKQLRKHIGKKQEFR